MHYEVRAVGSGSGLRDFLRLPFAIYRGNPHWVPPMLAEVRRTLDTGKNPYFADASLDMFVCYGDGVPCARAALVVSGAHCRKFNVRTGFFGFFESVDETACSQKLFAEIERRALERGVDTLEGPFNPNHYSELGLLADHYDEDQGFFEPYNPPYYHNLLRNSGFEAGETLFTGRREAIREFMHERYGPPPGEEAAGEYAVRCFNLSRMNGDLEEVRGVFNDAFESNWHFIAATAAEHEFAAKYLRMITEPGLVTIVEHRGKPVGVLMCVLDVNPALRRMSGTAGPLKYFRFLRDRKTLRTLVVYAVGIRQAYQGTRVFTLLLASMRRMEERFDTLTCTWMHPANTLSVATAARVGLEEHKHLLIYRKRLGREQPGQERLGQEHLGRERLGTAKGGTS